MKKKNQKLLIFTVFTLFILLGVNNSALGYSQITGGTASASPTEAGYPASQAFDSNESSTWEFVKTYQGTSPLSAPPPSLPPAPNAWLQYQLYSPKVVTGYRVVSNQITGCQITEWALYGRNDNTNWTLLHNGNESQLGQLIDDNDFTNTIAYKYYKLEFPSIELGSYIYPVDEYYWWIWYGASVSELELYEEGIPDPPTVDSFTANPNPIDSGGSSTLTWNTTDATSVSIPGVGSGLNPDDSVVVWPASTTTYVLTATGPGGTASDSVQVIVNDDCNPQGALSGLIECDGVMETDGSVESGTSATLIADVVILKPGFHAKYGSNLLAKTYDTQAPVIISAYPSNSSLVSTNGNPLTLTVTFGDNDTGVQSVTLLDSNNNDITSQAIIDNNSLDYTIQSPEDGEYTYTIILTDNEGNTAQYTITFTVDTVPPVTTASVEGGLYNTSFTVNLTCSEAATIYYSTDGNPPYPGLTNTTVAQAPVNGISVQNNTALMFYAVDTAGNIEHTKSEIYVLNEMPATATGISAVYSEANSRVDVSWQGAGGSISGYHVYRCNNEIDLEILKQSERGQYQPPVSLRISTNLITGTSFNDTDIILGGTYWYGVTAVDTNGIEGYIGEFAQTSITSSVPVQDTQDSIERATAWLESTQNKQGYWGEKENVRLLATSQILNAFNVAGKDSPSIRKALFYLRGYPADNNDYLARKIISLSAFGQNVDEMVNKLVSQSYIQSTYIRGWGMQEEYDIDAVDTALGGIAVDMTSQTLSFNNYAFNSLRDNNDLESAEPDRFGWIIKSDTSLFVSSLVYNLVNTRFSSTVFDFNWIINSQNPDGSFENGIIDTCGVLLWVDNLTTTERNDAIDYLISLQSPGGDWNNDPYLTGLCLEALLN